MDYLLSIELKSTAYGYRLVNQLPVGKDCQIVEATLLNKGTFWIFLQGELVALKKVSQEIDQSSVHFKKMTLLSEVDPTVKAALYSLQQEKVRDFLAIIETASVSDLLEVAHLATALDDVRLIELTQGRGMDGLCLGYITGGDSSALASTLSQYAKNQKLSHFEIISPVSEALADYFNIENL
jgi:hypothetical protein